MSVCLSTYTIRSFERRRVCVDHSSRRSGEIDTLLLLLTRLHKRSPIEQDTEIGTRKKERDSATPPELARKQARDATTTTPEQNNVVCKTNNKAQNLGNGGRSATNGFQIFGANGHISGIFCSLYSRDQCWPVTSFINNLRVGFWEKLNSL
jgi:hypothetical protein